ncbi:MAG: nitronate monooxygenase [Bdellovibrionota bacterium]|nr:MAG: nitronate monooxygenase [Pseudomonadota bacterium]
MANPSLSEILGIEHPIIGGAMYPCSNPELVAAVSEAGGIGIVQPVSLTFVNKYDFRKGLQHIRTLTKKPIGLNLLIEKSSQKYLEKNKEWLDIALEEGVRFFITALGNPDWVVEKVRPLGGVVFHDVTNAKWAEKAVAGGVDGLICVNNRAGGHAGEESPSDLMRELTKFGKPLICAGGIGDRKAYQEAMALGYSGVQIGTRFIASKECSAHEDYKKAILEATPEDIILTKKITGVPVAVINTGYMKSRGADSSAIAKFFLTNPKTKHYARMFYSLRSAWQLKQSLHQGGDYKEFYQAGKSVGGIREIESVKDIVRSWTHA